MDKNIPSSSPAHTKSGPILSGYVRYVFWIFFALSFFNYLDRHVLTGATSAIATDLGIGLDGIGYIASAFLIVYTFLTIPLGLWADRVPRKNVVALCVLVWSIATVFTALSINFATIFLARMVLGVGEAGYFPAGTALLSDYVRKEHRARVMSWWSIAELLGILVGYALGGVFSNLFPGSWRIAFLFTGAPGLIIAFFVWRLREPRRNQADEEVALIVDEATITSIGTETRIQTDHLSVPHVAQPSTDLDTSVLPSRRKRIALFMHQLLAEGRLLLRIKTLVAMIIMQIFAFFVLGVTVTFLPAYMQQKDIFGLKPTIAGLYSGGIVVLAGIVGAILGSYVTDWLNRRYAGARVLISGLVFLLGAPALALALLMHQLALFTIPLVLTVILMRVYNGPTSAATQDVVPARLRASAMALSLWLAHLFGDAFSPSIVGILATSFDPTHGQHFAHMMAGHDLSLALLVTCTPALVLAGLAGIIGSRWMARDVQMAEQTNQKERVQNLAI